VFQLYELFVPQAQLACSSPAGFPGAATNPKGFPGADAPGATGIRARRLRHGGMPWRSQEKKDDEARGCP
jgi:hypothetical protein